MSDGSRVRLDRWLWAARFFKTRALAAAAIGGGKVLVGSARAKRAKLLAVGDRLLNLLSLPDLVSRVEETIRKGFRPRSSGTLDEEN